MGGLSRRGFLKAISALSGALAVGATGFSIAADRAELFEWGYELFDYGNKLGVCASLIGPDGTKHRHAVIVPLRDAFHRFHHVADVRRAFPEEFDLCRQGLADWAEWKQKQWAA